MCDAPSIAVCYSEFIETFPGTASKFFLIMLWLLFTAIKLSLCGSSPYTSTDKANKNKYT